MDKILWFKTLFIRGRLKRVVIDAIVEQNIAAYNDIKDLAYEKLKELAFLWAYDCNAGCCETCGRKTKFLSKYSVYSKYCSIKCMNKDPVHKKKIKDALRAKYGVENPSKLKHVQNTIRERNVQKYGVDWVTKSSKFKDIVKQTNLERYGVEHVFQSEKIKEKIKQTNLERYGTEYATQSKDVQEKTKQTNLERYGVDNFTKTLQYKQLFQNKEWVQKVYEKIHQTKKKNGSYNRSKVEDKIYQLLVDKFGIVKRQYSSNLYPFACDFYIPEIDTYIEYQGWWHHGTEAFDVNNQKHLEKITLWQEQSIETNIHGERKQQYNSAIHTWTIIDPLKRHMANQNNLILLEFFNEEEFNTWYKKRHKICTTLRKIP